MKGIFFKCTLGIFLLCTGLFCAYIYMERGDRDTTPPVISAASDTIYASIHASDAELLRGVSAWDERDGDVSASLLVENISGFVAENTCTVTFAAFDAHNNVARCSCSLIYTDYSSPVFSLTGDLKFSYGASVDPLRHVKAADCIDGDISGRVTMHLEEGEILSSLGVHRVEFRVTNSKGDTASFPALVEVESLSSNESRRTPLITLSEYLIYVERGAAVDGASFVRGVSLGGEAVPYRLPNGSVVGEVQPTAPGGEAALGEDREIYALEISAMDTGTNGIKEIIYTLTTEDGYVGSTRLYVAVKE